jgi:hypothetical protein
MVRTHVQGAAIVLPILANLLEGRQSDSRSPDDRDDDARSQGHLHAERLGHACGRPQRRAGKQTKVGEPNQIFLATVDGTPFALDKIREGLVDVTVAQPLNLYAKFGAFYAKAALEGKTFSPGPTDHGSEIIKVGDNLMDSLPATVVTKDNASDPSLWGNMAK